LNTGDIRRSYPNNTGQISSIRFRPNSSLPIYQVASPPKAPAPSIFDDRRRGSLASNNSLESLFGDESPNGTMNEALLDPVIDNDESTVNQESVYDTPSSEQQLCRDVFLASSYDGGISLWDRRRDGMVVRLAPGSKGTPPWCTSVYPSPYSTQIRLVGPSMANSSTPDDGMGLSMSTPCIDHWTRLSELFASLGTLARSLLSPQCRMGRI
jgi:WD40 repeat protein